ncbi:TPA: hypothetical protein H1R09_003238 [Salmonella enterica]|nr:hypothetical protein [Salmonella enterica]HAK4240366.1 hypothetical protein [Salmonella enterica]
MLSFKRGKPSNKATAASGRGTRCFLLPRDTYANFSKAFQVGEWGCFYTIYSNFPIAAKDPKTNLSSGKSQQKQQVKIQKARLHELLYAAFYAGQNQICIVTN